MELGYLEDSSAFISEMQQTGAVVTPLNEIMCYSDLEDDLPLDSSKDQVAALPRSIKRATSGSNEGIKKDPRKKPAKPLGAKSVYHGNSANRAVENNYFAKSPRYPSQSNLEVAKHAPAPMTERAKRAPKAQTSSRVNNENSAKPLKKSPSKPLKKPSKLFSLQASNASATLHNARPRGGMLMSVLVVSNAGL
jgi:hypothetical protein